MSIQTAENQQALARISDMTRLLSLAILLIHFHYYCYGLFQIVGFVNGFTDRILENILKTGLLTSPYKSKTIALGLLVVSLIGTNGKKREKLKAKSGAYLVLIGLAAFWLPALILGMSGPIKLLAGLYISLTLISFSLILSGGTLLSRVIKVKLGGDIFNRENETFPQEERLLENEFSINLPAEYTLKGKRRKS